MSFVGHQLILNLLKAIEHPACSSMPSAMVDGLGLIVDQIEWLCEEQ